MIRMRHVLPAVFLSLVAVVSSATVLQGQDVRYEVHFPAPEGYQTLVCDLHMHTVFSDGLVWPTVRVKEVWRQGLDVMSITDHIEYQPHKDDVKTNHNRPYDLVKDQAKGLDLMLIRGTEITRDTPPGHFNAIFLEDINPLETPDFLDAIKAANAQGAFVFWNHQGWKGEEKGSWQEVHTTMLEGKLFHGMEVCNGGGYFPTAHKWCLEKNLTMIGNSDIHDPDLLTRSTAAEHRTTTLVFAKEKTPESVKEALFAGRTVVWYKDQLIGRREQLEPLFYGAVKMSQTVQRSGKSVWFQLQNGCTADIKLAKAAGNGPAAITIPAWGTVSVRFSVAAEDTPVDLQYTATNLLIAPETGLPVTLK
jgi:hypothetical protein